MGSAITRRLVSEGYSHIITRSSSELDLRHREAVEAFYAAEQPEYVFLAAAKVGGIVANNTRRAEFLFDNLAIQNNVIDGAYRHGVKKLLFLGSSCIYPKLAPQPLREEYLLTGPLEHTNEPYAIAKIAGIKMVEAYRDQYGFDAISCMPTNLYGPNDNFDPLHSHVLPALIRRFDEAKNAAAPSVTVWGTGVPMREFLHADDAAEAMIFLMNTYSGRDFVNVGTGVDIAIKDLVEMVAEEVGYQGVIEWDVTKPDGTPRKLMDVSRLSALGWNASIDLRRGLRLTIDWYRTHATAIRGR